MLTNLVYKIEVSMWNNCFYMSSELRYWVRYSHVVSNNTGSACVLLIVLLIYLQEQMG